MKDSRYKAIKSLIETGSISSFEEVFTIIPISTVKSDLKINYNTLRSHISNPALLTLKEITLLSELFEVTSHEVFKLAINDFTKKNKGSSKKIEPNAW